MASAHEPTRRPFVTLRWAVGGLLVVGVLTRLMGLLREIIVADSFGTSKGLDAIYLGLAIPFALSMGIGGGTGRAIVPAGSALEPRLLGGLLLMAARRLLLLVVPLAAVLMVTSPLWSPLLIPADSKVPVRGVLIGAALGCVAIVGGTLSGLCVGLSNSQGRHLSANATPFLHNGIIILCVLLLSPAIGVYSLLIGIVLAEWGQVIALLPFLRRLLSRITFPGAEVLRAAEALFWPSVLLATVSGLMGAVDRLFAATLPEGGVSALAYAERLLNFPVLLVGMAIQSPLYTRLARFAAEKQFRSFEMTLLLGLRMLLLIGAPIGILVTGFAEPIIALLLERGEFTAQDTALSAVALRGYAISIAFLSMLPLLASAGLALGRAWFVVAIYGTCLVLNAILDALLVERFGLLGIAIATSVVAAVIAVALVGIVAPRLLRARVLWRSMIVAFIVATICALMLYLFRTVFPLPGRGLPTLVLYLGAGGVITLAGTALVAFPLIRAELRSLRSLRRIAAEAGGLVAKE